MAKKAYIGVETTSFLNSLGDVAVGSTIKINENGSPVDYLVVHQGNPNNALYDSSCNGTWVLRKEIFEKVVWDSDSTKNYANSNIHSYLNSTFLSRFGATEQNAIKQVKIPYYDNSAVQSGVNGLSSKIFLLTGCEVGWGGKTYLADDGAKLDYFMSGDTTDAKNLRIAMLNGTKTQWLLRTKKTGANLIWGVKTTGDWTNGLPAYGADGVRPAFILPSSCAVTDGVVTGAQAETVARGVARKVKKGYIGVENFVPRTLPSGYTQVEYIQSSGTQYVDTGVTHSSANNIVLQADVSYDTVSPTNQIMGFNGSAGNGIGTSGAAWWEASSISNATVGTRYALEWGVNGSSWHRTVNGKTVTGSRSSTSFTTNMYLFAAQASATSTSMAYYCSCKLYSAKVLVNGSVVRDYVPCKNSSGTVGLYDVANGSFYQNSGSGTFAAGATSCSVARKIKKAYIGIGGVARPCWSGGEPVRYGRITDLSAVRYELAATSVGDYALFAGGYASEPSAVVDTYTSSLVKGTAASMTYARMGLAATTVGNYAIFGGGRTKSSTSYATNSTNAYSGSLTNTSISKLRYTANNLAATTVGSYAIFGGGNADGSARKYTTAYNTSLTLSNPPSLTTGDAGLAAATVGNCALFAGGGSYAATVNGINSSLTLVSVSSLGKGCLYPAATSIQKYAMFGGGIQANTTIAALNCYDASLTRTYFASGLSAARYRFAATRLGNYALFAGGAKDTTVSSTSVKYDIVDMFDESLTRTNPDGLYVGRSYLSGTTVGNYAIFAGGNGGGAAVDAYTIA